MLSQSNGNLVPSATAPVPMAAATGWVAVICDASREASMGESSPLKPRWKPRCWRTKGKPQSACDDTTGWPRSTS